MGIFILCITPFIIISIIIFEILIRIQFDYHREDWENDGEPNGFFWVPKNGYNKFKLPKFKGARARGLLTTKWLFFKPDWIKEDKKANCLLKWYRIFTFISIVIFLIPIIFFLGILLLYFIGYKS